LLIAQQFHLPHNRDHDRGLMISVILTHSPRVQNLLLDAGFHLKLIDFGTAKSVGHEQYGTA
jgi:serine/threonine protein kinase